MDLFESKNYMIDYVKKKRIGQNQDHYFIQRDKDVICLEDSANAEQYSIPFANVWRVRVYYSALGHEHDEIIIRLVK